jgi:hypothetical protein
VEHELSAGIGRVDVFNQAVKLDLALLQILDALNQILERAPQPIQAPYNK